MSLTKTALQESLDKSLKKFAEEIQVEEEGYLSEGIRLCENVRVTLEDNMGSLLDSSCSYFARSVTVGTEPPFQVVPPDFAIILKVLKHPLTPLENVEAESQCILGQHKSGLGISRINPTSDIMLISFKNGACAYLLVECTTNDTQMDELLEKLENRGDSRRFQNVSVGLQHFEFMESQPEFTVLLIRLANYWLKSKDLSYGTGVTVIFELLAVAVGEGEEKDEGESLTSAFIKMAKLIENLSKLQLAFTDDVSETYSDFVGEGVPYLMEPCSQAPNNLIDELEPEQMEVLMKTGKEMRESLEKFMKKSVFNVSVGSDGFEIDFNEMFIK